MWPPRERPEINGLHCIVQTPYGPVGFSNIHLGTPKPALQLILDPKKILDLSQVNRAVAQLECRRLESRDLARCFRGFSEPTIIAGDFNMPVESGLYQDYWSEYQNAFSQTGVGLGHTKHTRVDIFRYGSRIDHILCDGRWIPAQCWVGPDLGSDHLPVIADFTFD
jgi:endonuclease/exonuclease/phosphatase (EEP) superfamily protein YafD